MTQQPTQRQVDDRDIRSGLARRPQQFFGRFGGPRVLVKKRNVLFVCRQDRTGWKCGSCLRGNLGERPQPSTKCRVCGARVR